MSFQSAFTDLDCVEVGWIAGRNVADFYLLVGNRLGGQAANTILRVLFVIGTNGSFDSDQECGTNKRCKESKHSRCRFKAHHGLMLSGDIEGISWVRIIYAIRE